MSHKLFGDILSKNLFSKINLKINYTNLTTLIFINILLYKINYNHKKIISKDIKKSKIRLILDVENY